MRWPWVRRDRLEHLERALAYTESRLNDADKHYQALADQLRLATTRAEDQLAESVRNWERECERRENLARAELNAVIGDRQAAELHGRVAVAQAHEEWVGRLQQLIAAHAAEMAAERQRHADLVAQLLELRREGFNPPAAGGGPTTPLKTIDAVIVKAIGERSESGSDLELQLARWAESELARGTDPAKIAQAILEGGDFEEADVAA